jgi:aryl-alcohol dehydrogenase-like predicted oxidoreductase
MTPCTPAAACPQVQYSLLDRRPENEMVSYCLDKGIGLLPYGVVAGGILSDK